MGRHVVVGKGPVGSTLAELLAAQGHEVTVVSRSGGAPGARSGAGRPAVEHRAADASDADALSDLARGADALYNCANPAYHRWTRDWPPLAAALLDAAERAGAVLVTMSNVYGYGPVDRPMTEDLPLATTGTKGRVRARMWQDALARHEAGRLRTTEVRASDFVGPGVTDGGHLAARVVPRLLAGKAVRVFGDPDQPHSWTDVRAVVRTLARAGADERAWGRAWHVPTAGPVTQREAVGALCRAAGIDPVRVAPMPAWALRAAGLAVPLLRELQETRYQFEHPFVLDSSAWTRTFGDEPPSLEQTWADTVAWWQAREAVAA